MPVVLIVGQHDDDQHRVISMCQTIAVIVPADTSAGATSGHFGPPLDLTGMESPPDRRAQAWR